MIQRFQQARRAQVHRVEANPTSCGKSCRTSCGTRPAGGRAGRAVSAHPGQSMEAWLSSRPSSLGPAARTAARTAPRAPRRAPRRGFESETGEEGTRGDGGTYQRVVLFLEAFFSRGSPAGCPAVATWWDRAGWPRPALRPVPSRGRGAPLGRRGEHAVDVTGLGGCPRLRSCCRKAARERLHNG